MAPLDDLEERRVLYAALDSFRQYRQAAHYNITHLRRQSFYSLSSKHLDILCDPPFSLPDTLRKVDDAIDANAEIAEAILEIGLLAFGLTDDDEWQGQATANDNDKARSTIKQIYRDWSADGSVERHACFGPILLALEQHLTGLHSADRGQVRILVPGAGLGRLVLEVCKAGYAVEGNEISYHQLLASNFLLNYTQHAHQYQLYPWALTFSNHLSRADQLRTVAIPDVHPAQDLLQSAKETWTPPNERMSMSAGDFTVVYRNLDNREAFDAVTTCFFIDTAPNLIHYIETVRFCLKTKGIWINLGPLLWHFESAPTPAEKARQKGEQTTSSASDTSFEGIGDPGSFELANDEVLALLEHSGFQVVEQKEMPAGATGYIQDPRSMLQNVYKPVFWVARKI